MPSHVTTGHDNGGGMYESDDDDDDDPTDFGGSFVGKNVVRRTMKNCRIQEDEEHGGKVHMSKSMRHLGNAIKKTGSEFGTAVKKAGINEVSKTIAQEGVKFIKNNASKALSGAEAVMPEVLPVAEEAAPLMLMAAGMKKEKRTRQVSQKEASRHALIRKLMQKHGCTLAEASRHIKEKNLSY